jgi:hypothetical protein
VAKVLLEVSPVKVVFKFSTDDMSVEVEGPEEWVQPHIQFLMPFLRRTTGAGEAGSEGGDRAAQPRDINDVGAWWAAKLPNGANPSMQDTILLFAFFMRSFRKTVFVSDDIRRCFSAMGLEEPKSLLQILGTLKRDHGMLLNAGKRGEYMMNTTGIARVRELLGEEPRTTPAAPSGDGDSTGADGRPTVGTVFGD